MTEPVVTVPPRIGVLLTQAAETSDIETALRKVLTEYLDLKIAALERQVAAFEAKWGMAFPVFGQQCQDGTLKQDPYAYEVEKDFWEWERAETLLQHYQRLQAQWM